MFLVMIIFHTIIILMEIMVEEGELCFLMQNSITDLYFSFFFRT